MAGGMAGGSGSTDTGLGDAVAATAEDAGRLGSRMALLALETVLTALPRGSTGFAAAAMAVGLVARSVAGGTRAMADVLKADGATP